MSDTHAPACSGGCHAPALLVVCDAAGSSQCLQCTPHQVGQVRVEVIRCGACRWSHYAWQYMIMQSPSNH